MGNYMKIGYYSTVLSASVLLLNKVNHSDTPSTILGDPRQAADPSCRGQVERIRASHFKKCG